MAHSKYETTCAVFETYPSVNVKAYTMCVQRPNALFFLVTMTTAGTTCFDGLAFEKTASSLLLL
jgi:hypothetical protein